MTKVLQINTDDEALMGEISAIRDATREMSQNDLDQIKATLEKSTKSREMHGLLKNSYQFYKDALAARKKKKPLPERDNFIQQVLNTEKINDMLSNLPAQEEID